MHVAEYMGYRTLRFERRERVLRVTIDRAEVLNAINGEMHEDLSRVFEEINRDEGCDVVVLTGAGKAFCAGGGVTEIPVIKLRTAALRPERNPLRDVGSSVPRARQLGSECR